MHRDSDEIRSLTGLRGLAALWVFCHHASLILRGTVLGEPVRLIAGQGGDLGVDVFFVLSGFVLALNYSRAHESASAWLGFLRKRLARIYPVHLVGLGFVGVVSLIGVRHPTSLEGLFYSLTLTHAWAYPIVRMWNAYSWSVSAEWLAYILFPAIAAVTLRIRSPLVILGAIALLDAALWSVMSTGFYGHTADYGLIRIATEFPAGVLLHHLWAQNKEPAARWDFVALGALLLLICGASIAVSHEHRIEFAAGATLPLAGLVVYALARGTGRFLAGKWWVRAGQISYAFYIIHGTALMVAYHFTLYTSWTVPAVLLTFVLSIGAAWALYEYVEKPGRRLILEGFKPRRARPAQSPIPETP